MKKLLIAMTLFLVAGSAQAGDVGTVRITNRDGAARVILIDPQQRILHVYPNAEDRTGEVVVPSGGLATTQLASGAWTVYGDDEPRFTIMVRQDGDYDLTLQPFSQTNAYGGASNGLLGVIDDGYNHSSYRLFALAEVPTTVIVQPAPATPPVVVVPGPSHYYPPHYYRRDKGRDLGEAIGSAVFDILGEALSDDHHHRRW